METTNFIELQENLRKNAEELLSKNVKQGTVINDVLSKIEKKDIRDRLYKSVGQYDKNILFKNDYVQRVTLNRALLTHVLKLCSSNDINLTPMVVLLSYTSELKQWKRVVSKHIIPTLIKNDLI